MTGNIGRQHASSNSVTPSPSVLLSIALAATACVLVALYARAHLASSYAEPHPLTVETRQISRTSDLTVDRWYSGKIEPRQRLQIASELAGKVQTVYVDEGGQVAKGDVLLELDKSILNSERKRLQSSLAGLEAERELARRRLARQTDLKADGFSAEDTIDGIETNLKLLAARRETLLAQIERIDIQLDKSVVRAPFDANIQRRLIDVGAVIVPGTPLLELLESGTGEVKVGIPVEVARSVAPGDLHQVQIRDETATARVISVAPAVEGATQTVAIRLQLRDLDFRFGEFVNLHFATPEDGSGFWIPNSALVEDERGLWSIFALDADSTVNKYAASIIYADNRNAFVDISGEDDINLIVSGLNRIAPGMIVGT